MVFVIIVYDVRQDRVTHIHKFLKGYLHWKQNSVFEGRLSKGELSTVIGGITDIIDPEYDMVYIYEAELEKYLTKTILGTPKRETRFIF